MLNTIMQDFPTCPYCGYSSPHIQEFLKSEACKRNEVDTWNCNNCGENYNVFMFIKYLFTTRKIEK